MKNKLKTIFKIACIFILCFALIYLIVFLGAWKLFESGDPILIEIGFALILSVFVFIFLEVCSSLEKRIKTLEKKLEDIEKKK